MRQVSIFALLVAAAAISLPAALVKGTGAGILYPQDSESRELRSLDGIWNFKLAPRLDANLGFSQSWFNAPLETRGPVELMPVPSSYNDITQSKAIRDHVGWVWYDRTFWIPKPWVTNQQEQRIFLRFGGVNYHTIVWINGVQVLEHSGAHLPFQVELNSTDLLINQPNRITVAVNNTLTSDTVPQGKVVHETSDRYPKGYFTLNYNFDFFNYAGIHRSVFLYTTPRVYIDDITISTDVIGTTGHLSYSISMDTDGLFNSITAANLYRKKKTIATYTSASSRSSPAALLVTLEDKKGLVVASSIEQTGKLVIANAKLWWPLTMVENDNDAGYQYTLVVNLLEPGNDVYRLKVGLRSVRWNNTSFLINNQPFYFRGFGRHEDFSIRGKGIDNANIVKDHNLVKWTGANSYRTSHYPYSEEIMDLTDSLGIVIIDEVPAVSLDGFGPTLLATHKRMMTELIQRDKNRPSVVMWSVGNEPQSQKAAADPYFNEVVGLTKMLDSTRPVTMAVAQDYSSDVTAKHLDILCINRYYSWYSDAGHTELIEKSTILDVGNWIKKFNRPLIMAEYGSDTIAGLHMDPEFVFTEEYQLTLMRENFKAFDFLRGNTSFIGEMIWNFADFMTAQGITRVTGNRKGIFTRDRQPKASAHFLRARYHLLANEANGYPIPAGLHSETPVYASGVGRRRTEL